MSPPTLAPDLLHRLERLAEARRTNQEDLLSEAVRAYLDREESETIPKNLFLSRRTPGGDEGRVIVAPDFNAPLPKDIEDSFYP